MFYTNNASNLSIQTYLNTKSLFVKVVQKMCFDGQLQYTRYMHNLNYFKLRHSIQGRP